MTNNQINYAKLREDTRHNVVGERIERDKAHSSRIQALTSMYGLQETAKHNRATEQLGSQQLSESIRHNTATETRDLSSLAEARRSNLAREQETARTNRVNEVIKDYVAHSQDRIGQIGATASMYQAQASLRQADASMSQAETARQRQFEDVRHNVASEQLNSRNITNQYNLGLASTIEANRHNLIGEKETARHNYAGEVNAAKDRTQRYSLGMEDIHVKQDRNRIAAVEAAGSLASSILRVGGLF
nr:putative ORF1 [Marmot picobirnavirus]